MRIVTRGDIDGVMSSILVSEMEDVKDIALIHPQDITDKRFPVDSKDILVNIPYDPACAMWSPRGFGQSPDRGHRDRQGRDGPIRPDPGHGLVARPSPKGQTPPNGRKKAWIAERTCESHARPASRRQPF